MSQTLQGITFGFFESLPDDARTHLKDILYGDKAQTARPDLPWDDEESTQTVEPPVESSVSAVVPDEDCTDQKSSEAVPPSAEAVPEPVTSVAAPTADLVPQTLPPGIPQPMYHPGIPVVQGLPQVYGYPCVYPQPGVYRLPMCGPNVSQSPCPEHIPMDPNIHAAQSVNHDTHAARSVDQDIYPDNNNKLLHNDVMEKESSKILAGKTYERRNKKRRPPDYYQKLEAKQSVNPSIPPQECMGAIHGPLGPMYTVIASNQTMVTSGHQLAPFHPSIPPPGHHLAQSMYHPHPSSPGYHLQTSSSSLPASSSTSPRVLQNVLPRYGPGITHVTMPPPPLFPSGTPVPGPPGAQSYPDPHPVPVVPQGNAPEGSVDAPAAPCDAQGSVPCSKPAELTSDDPDMKDTSAVVTSTECTMKDSISISFGEVDTELRNIEEEKNVFPWDHRNNNVKKPSPVKDKIEASTTATVVSVDCTVVNMDCAPVTSAENTADVSSDASPPAIQDPPRRPEDSPQHEDSQTSGAKHISSDENATLAIPEKSDPVAPDTSETLSHAQNMLNQNNTNALDSEADGAAVGLPAKPKATSWAGLFRGTSTAEAATVIYNENRTAASTNSLVKKPDPLPETVSVEGDRSAKQLGWVLKEYSMTYKPPSIQPRGLVNRGNWCYVNATLQALLACSPLYNLLKRLPFYPRVVRGPTSTPVLDSMVEFVNEFSPMPPIKPVDKNKVKSNIKYDVPTGASFEVNYVYKMLQVIKYDGFKSGRQEDAEEFLGCVLNGLHDEMVASIKSMDEATADKANHGADGDVTTNGDAEVLPDDMTLDDDSIADDGWEQVGPKNKSVVTRATKSDVSPISEIFRGQFRNVLSRPGVKESATLQPFFTLQLDIQSEKVATVQDALENLVSREALQGFTCSRTNVEVDASRRTMLEGLPPVLVLHLKCFVYDKSGGCQKVVKQVDFSNELEINKELLSPTVKTKYPQAQRKYKLFAVVKHVGVRAVGGHYTTDVFYQNLGEWLHFDDNHVTTVSMPQVFKFRPARIPYLLYYRRSSDLS